MIGKRDRRFTEFERLGEEGVRSAVARGKFDGERLAAAQTWLDRREQKRARQYKVDNKKANIILAIATAMGALIVSIAAIG